ncbi:MAG: tetratricopeptide repeat protein [Candidatus Omnitrophica bacterium]|nr:tetratricopeptide repeat protein [Candidatus Omnitrophota bacterium]
MKSSSFKIWSALAIICLGLMAYSNTFHASFQFDDKPSITANYAIKHLGDISTIWNSWPCRFLTYLSFAFNYRLSYLDVLGYHLTNILIHLGAALLLWWLTLLTFETPVMKNDKLSAYANRIALLAGLIFVSHPIQTEAVTYIVQRASSLAGLFYLATLSCYVKARLLEEDRSKSTQRRVFYVFALILTVGTMFTKEHVITLPFAILLYEGCFLKRGNKFDWQKVAPFLLTVFIIPLSMVLTKYIDLHGMRRTIEGPQGISSLEYLLTQFRVILTYIRLLILPINQNLDYEYSISHSLFELDTFVSLMILIAIFFIALRLFKNFRLLAFSIFWFFLTLLPESSIIPIRDVIFEHRLYLPMVGYSLFLVGGIFYIAEKKSLKIVCVLLGLVIGINSYLTYERNKVWQDEFHLWDDTVHKSPHKERPVNVRGSLYEALGKYDLAIADYNKSMELNPHFIAPLANRGNSYFKQGQLDLAIADYTRVIQLIPNDSGTYNNRGSVYLKQGDLGKAVKDFNKAIELNPVYFDAYANRGDCYMKLGKVTEALADYNKTVRLSPDSIQAYNNRANLYDRLKDFDKAVQDYTQAIRLNPKMTVLYLNRGASYFREGRFHEAEADFSQAIQLNGAYREAYINRAVTYLKLQNYDRAWQDVHRAEQLGASFPALRQSLEKATGRNQ